jgi:hypothetical protein
MVLRPHDIPRHRVALLYQRIQHKLQALGVPFDKPFHVLDDYHLGPAMTDVAEHMYQCVAPWVSKTTSDTLRRKRLAWRPSYVQIHMLGALGVGLTCVLE